jgi:D-alanyl-D-alanine carboxypeptidase (penicillin-binding protein 5/6)
MMATDDGGIASGVVLAEPSSGSGRHRRGNAHRHARNRRHRRWPWVVVAIVLLAVAGAAWVAVARIGAPLPPAVPRPATDAGAVVPGPVPSLPWPTEGQGAVSVPAIGYQAQSGPESPVPVASLTKITSAVVILQDHPLGPDDQGPVITVSADDVAQYDLELHMDESTVAIEVGEQLTERQALEALLTQSANDVAYTLAVWDAGSIDAFVAKMNALATSLGDTDTHYVDASGYDPQTVSSAADVLRMAAVGMAIPTFADIVGMTEITLPLAGTLHNIVSQIGVDGVIGVKSGYTSQAGACMVLAADRVIDGRVLLVLVAVTGQPTPPPTAPTTTTTTRAPAGTTTTTTRPSGTTTTTTTLPLNDEPVVDPFKYAGPTTQTLLTAAQAGIARVTVATEGGVAGKVTSTWGGQVHTVTYVTASGAWLPGWPGQAVRTVTRFTPVPPGSAAGTRVGSTLFAVGTQFQVVPLRLHQTVPEPSLWWRLRHGGTGTSSPSTSTSPPSPSSPSPPSPSTSTSTAAG